MTRGAEIEGPFEIDQVMARPDGWLERIAAAPQLDPPGSRFRATTTAGPTCSGPP